MNVLKKILSNTEGIHKLYVTITSTFVLLIVVITYQMVASRQDFSDDNVFIPDTYSGVQIFPQTMPVLSSGFYELWINSNGWISVSKFSVDANGQAYTTSNESISENTFNLPQEYSEISEARITISQSPSPRAGEVIEFLNGPIRRDRVALKFNQFPENRSGQYMLATPTDSNSFINERSGLWFGDVNQANPLLNLPTPNQGWVYEGWVEIDDGEYLTTGRFTNVNRRDQFSGFSENINRTPAFPGEDFLQDPPVNIFDGIVFPIDIAGKTVLITMEPDIDGVDPTGQSIFGINLLSDRVPSRAVPRRLYNLDTVDPESYPVATVVFR